MCREGVLGKQLQAFPPHLLPSVTAPKNPKIWQAASAPEDKSMSGTLSKQLIYARNKKSNLLDTGGGWYLKDTMRKKTYRPDSEVSYHLPWINLANLGHRTNSFLMCL